MREDCDDRNELVLGIAEHNEDCAIHIPQDCKRLCRHCQGFGFWDRNRMSIPRQLMDFSGFWCNSFDCQAILSCFTILLQFNWILQIASRIGSLTSLPDFCSIAKSGQSWVDRRHLVAIHLDCALIAPNLQSMCDRPIFDEVVRIVAGLQWTRRANR